MELTPGLKGILLITIKLDRRMLIPMLVAQRLGQIIWVDFIYGLRNAFIMVLVGKQTIPLMGRISTIDLCCMKIARMEMVL